MKFDESKIEILFLGFHNLTLFLWGYIFENTMCLTQIIKGDQILF